MTRVFAAETECGRRVRLLESVSVVFFRHSEFELLNFDSKLYRVMSFQMI